MVARELFDKLDLDRSGGLNSHEFRNAIQQYTLPHEMDLAGALQIMMDTTSAGVDMSIELRGFLRSCEGASACPGPACAVGSYAWAGMGTGASP